MKNPNKKRRLGKINNIGSDSETGYLRKFVFEVYFTNQKLATLKFIRMNTIFN